MSKKLSKRRASLKRVTASLVSNQGKIGRLICIIGSELLRVRQEELWRDGEHLDFDDYLASETDMARTAAYRFMRAPSTSMQR